MASAVTYDQLETTFNQQPPGSLYLVVGEEDLLRDYAIAALKRAVLGSDGDEFNYELFYGDEASGSEIRNSVAAVPAFAPRRLVVVKSAEKLTAREGDLLLGCVQNPVESTTLVFVSPKLDGRLKFSQALTRLANIVDCSPLRDVQLPPWIKQEAERVGVRLEEQAVHVLREACGSSLYGLRRELEKLASFVPSDRPATAADVHLLRGVDPGASVFDLTQAIAESDRGRVLSILARNLEAGEAPLRILGSLAWQYRRLWKVKELLAKGGREGEAARILRMDPRKLGPFLEPFSEAHCQRALRLFLDTDAKLKGGSGSRPRMVLEGLLLKLCEEKTRKQGESRVQLPVPPKRTVARVVSNVRTIKRRTRTER